MTGCREDIETFSRLDKAFVDLPLPPAKNPAATTKNVRGKSRARDRITEGQGAEHSTNRIVLAVEAAQRNVVAMVNKNIFQVVMGVAYPAFNPDAEVTHEEIFDVQTAPPNMIRMQVTIVCPIVPGENVSAPKAHINFPVRIPFRARRRSDLLYVLA